MSKKPRKRSAAKNGVAGLGRDIERFVFGARNGGKRQEPHVVMCGGGPAGLFASILLDDVGISSTVLECSSDCHPQSSRPHVMNLNERGQNALDRAGCLIPASRAGRATESIYLLDGDSGDVKRVRKKEIGIAMTLTGLVECLEKIIATKGRRISLKKGVTIARVTECDGDPGLRVHADDGTVFPGSHVIGADGKWSRVRRSFPELDSQSSMETCPIFVVRMDARVLREWKADGPCRMKPSDDSSKFYVKVIPNPDDEGLVVLMFCFDEIVEQCPWLEPPEAGDGEEDTADGWGDEHSRSHATLPVRLEEFFRNNLPALHGILDEGAYRTARVHRRLSWLRMAPGEEGGRASFSANAGRAALVGDAAHAMTPSLGEGCNAALESSSKLVERITFLMEERGEKQCSVDTLSEAFALYGTERPVVAQMIQRTSLLRDEFLRT